MDPIHKLIHIFSDFPGIGPRQAKRFVYFLLTRPQGYLEELSQLVKDIRRNMRTCDQCQRFYAIDKNTTPLCLICRDKNRDEKTLMIVSRDVDLETVERSKSYSGHYFVLGGTVPILEKNPETKIRQKELLTVVNARKQAGLQEIILALNANAEGENTADYIKNLLSPLKSEGVKLSILGRGLSTGTELEYSDGDTIKSALKNRE